MFSILLIAGYALLMPLLLVHASVTLAWMLYTWRSPEAANDAGFVMIRRRPKHSFTLLVPARHEEEVLEETLDRLAASHYPDFEILAIIGHDDHGTREIAETAARRHPELIRVITDHSWPKQAQGTQYGTDTRQGRSGRGLRCRRRGACTATPTGTSRC